MEADLLVSEVAKIAGCHPQTVKNYERRGYIKHFRDHNGFRRYTHQEAIRLKEILRVRRPVGVTNG